MITIKNIQKSFGENKVLKGIDLTVKKGEVVTILGPSGSGKTTFLRCLNLLERPENGEISMHDQIINCKKPSKKEVLQLRKNTAMVFQQYNLFSHKTVIQNVMEGLTVARKMPKKIAREIAERELTKVGLADKLVPILPNFPAGKNSALESHEHSLLIQTSFCLMNQPPHLILNLSVKYWK